jgi:hypothetical protein
MDLAALIVVGAIFLLREYVHRLEMREEAVQRNMLLQRIQAPREIAYKEFAETLPLGAPSEPIYTDEDAWEALGHLPPQAVDEKVVSEWELAMQKATQ